jgi:hypothetical protein
MRTFTLSSPTPWRRSGPFTLAFPVCLPLIAWLASCGPVAPPAPPHRSPIDISTPAEAWNAANDPLRLRDYYDVAFATLPLTADLERKPWTDTYWPSYRAGLAQRWNDPAGPDPFTYALPTETDVRAMDADALARLSPAEKYDIFLGRFDYPFVSYERDRTSPTDPGWFGLCHGWAPAALNFEEPGPVVLESPSGISIPFGSSDVKALVLYVQQSGIDTRFVGSRCNSDDDVDADDPECRDINAGSFHVILANQIALLQQGFVAEVNRTSQVWNQPVYGFTSEVQSVSTDVYPGAAPGTTSVATVRTSMRYIVEMGPSWSAMPFADFTAQGSESTYDYTVELDAHGDVIGGEWISTRHPDFLWTQTAPRFSGYFKEVATIYEAATR